MKNSIKYIATVIAALTLTVGSIVANNGTTDTTDFVVNGKILKTIKKHNSNCTVELLNENNVVKSSVIKMNKSFEFKLKKNVWYTIRVTKEGYLPLLISFNTELGNESTILDNLFRFETALIDLEEAKSMNKDLIDFPVGIVAFNKETQKFEAKDVYTNNYIAKLNTNEELSTEIVKECITKSGMADGMC